MSGTGIAWALNQLAKLFGIGLAILVVLGLLRWGPLNDGKARCTFYGDSLALGGTVYVDGKWLGVLQTATQPNMTVLERRVRRGQRHAVVVSRTGDSLSSSFISKAEAVVWVSFADSSIDQWSD